MNRVRDSYGQNRIVTGEYDASLSPIHNFTIGIKPITTIVGCGLSCKFTRFDEGKLKVDHILIPDAFAVLYKNSVS